MIIASELKCLVGAVEHAELVPILGGKRAIAGDATAYVCEHGVCAYPARDPETFARQLAPKAAGP